jgi:hypothetical protein
MNPFSTTLSLTGLNSASDPSTGAGPLYLALKIAAAADPGDYAGRTPVREVVNRWKAAGYLDSLVGKSIAPLLEDVAMRERG